MKTLQAAKKPIPITVAEVTEEMLSGKDRPVRVQLCADQLAAEPITWKVWNELHNSWIGVKVGDFLNVTNPNDVYPIDRDYFAKHYEVLH